MPVPTNDLFEVAARIARAHADALASQDWNADILLIAAGRCPDCAAPLLLCDGAGYCTACKQEVGP